MMANEKKLQPMSDASFKGMMWLFKFIDLIRDPRRRLKKIPLKEGMAVVDYGCGPGRYTLPVANLVGPKGKVFAVDIQPLAISTIKEKAARESLTNIEAILVDSYNTGIQGSSIDLVLLLDTLHLIGDCDALFREIHRILKQDVLAATYVTAAGNNAKIVMKAIIFDCDGVLADTERDGHRVAFNKAFAAKGFTIDWDVELYGKLLEVSGGKERMRHYFDHYGWPDDVSDRDALIKELHKLKTDFFMQIIESGELPLRPGVARLVDEAIAANMTLAVCSTSHERAVHLVVERLLGPQRKAHFSAILAGDVVSKKKPDPEIYNLASQRLGLEPAECVVVEDSRNGLLAAKAAGMYCTVTTNGYTEDEDFTEADLVVSELGDEPNIQVTLEEIKRIVEGS